MTFSPNLSMELSDRCNDVQPWLVVLAAVEASPQPALVAVPRFCHFLFVQSTIETKAFPEGKLQPYVTMMRHKQLILPARENRLSKC